MDVLWLILLSIGLCFDTLAVSVSIGINDRKVAFFQALKIAFILAFFQGLMPFLGWLSGKTLENYIMFAIKARTVELTPMLQEKGRAPISLSMGAPVDMVPEFVVERLKEYLKNPEYHKFIASRIN